MRALRFLLLFAALLLPEALAAQVGVTTDILRGRVTGPGGEPVAGARVDATSLETGVTRGANTGQDGRYTITFPDGGGRYRIQVSRVGFATATTNVAREADEDVLVANVVLGTAAVAIEGIEVRASRTPPPGRGDAGAQERTLSSAVTSRLPLENNDAATLASLSPGVVTVTQGDSLDMRGAFSVAGQRTALNQVTLDGGSFASALTGGQAGGGSPLGVPQEGVRATSVVTTTYDVARGQFAGGQVAITTRGGTNQVQGSFNYQLRDPMLQGNAGVTPLSGSFTQNRLSGGIGGPIIRNKLFYNLSFAVQRRIDDQVAIDPGDPAVLSVLGVSRDSVERFLSVLGSRYGLSPLGQTGSYQRTGDALSLLGRVDYSLSDRHTLMLRGNWSGYDQDSTRIGFLELKQNGGEMQTGGGGGMLSLTSRFGGGWINEARASYNDDRRDMTPYVQIPEGRVRVTSVLADGTRGVSTLAFGGDRSLPTTTRERTVEVSDELSWLFRDTHRIKLGGLVNHSGFDQRISNNLLGSFTFNSLNDFAAGRPASFTRSLSDLSTQGGGLNAALYLGDTWRPTQKLQLTYGLRLEGSSFDDQPRYNPAVESTFGFRTDRIPSEVHLSPRAGFSYRLNEQGAPLRVLRGGIGEFRGRAPFSLYAGALNQTGQSTSEAQLVCIGSAVPAPDFSAFASDPGSIPTSCTQSVPQQGSGSRPIVTVFDQEFGAPRSWRGSLGFQAQLRPGLTGSVDVSHVRGVNLFGVRDLNLRETPAFTLAEEDGRPVFVPASAIVPGTGETALLASRVHPEFAQVFAVNSDLASQTSQLTFALNGIVPLPTRISFQASYTLMRARDQSSFSCCSAQQGYASVPVGSDPNRLAWATSDLERRHSVTLVAGLPVRPWLEVTLIGRASSGAPFTPMVGGDINGDGARNDAAFIFDPTSAPDTALSAGMQRVLAAVPGRVRECLASQTGEVAKRNSCRGDWSRSLDLRATLRPVIPGLQRRFSVSLDAYNVPAGLDLLLHGEGNLSGWGDAGRGRVDETLLYPRGFDPATQRFRYEVNERFGQRADRRFGAGSPFQVQLSGQIQVGRVNNFGGGLAAIGFGGGGGGGGGGGRFGGGEGGRGGVGGFGGGPGGGVDADAIIQRVLPNPVPVILSLRDTLHLSEEQVTRIQAISDSLRTRNEPIAAQIRSAIEGAGASPDPGAIFQRIGPRVNEGRRNVQNALTEVQKVLTPEQWRKVPAALRNPFNGFGGPGGGGFGRP